VVTTSDKIYDVIIVGSGAGGGMAAFILTQKKLKVLLLEAGRHYDPETETAMFNTPQQAPLRGVSTPDKNFGFYDATVDGGWEVPNEPYVSAPGSEFKWWRPRMLGGRTNHWGRYSFRYGPYDFKPYSRDGLGVDWPVSYDEIAPWYDKVERLIGVTGRAEGLENVPDSPPGCHLPPPAMRPHEAFLARGFKAMGIPVASTRAAILTQPHNGRPACLWATPCGRGCSIAANFQSTTVLLPVARATGNLVTRPNSLVYQVDMDKAGKARGVSFVDRITGEHHSARGNAVILSAGACESARILLNSKTGGLSNSSGLVGRYLMDTVGSTTAGYFPALEKLPRRNDDGMSVGHIYVPWWGLNKQKELGFARGYHIEIFGGQRMPSMRLMGDYADQCATPFGVGLRQEMRQKYGAICSFDGRGEMIPNENSYCEIDPTVTDKWGIPVLRFHWKWSEHETRQASHMRKTFLELIDRLGGTPFEGLDTDGEKAISVGGEIIHEVGTARMGDHRKNSVVNSYGQSWDVKNLFIMDGGVMPSSPDKNPTETILALTWRNATYLAEQARAGAL
jgi:choline dehydrogenase-like flavoprotein